MDQATEGSGSARGFRGLSTLVSTISPALTGSKPSVPPVPTSQASQPPPIPAPQASPAPPVQAPQAQVRWWQGSGSIWVIFVVLIFVVGGRSCGPDQPAPRASVVNTAPAPGPAPIIVSPSAPSTVFPPAPQPTREVPAPTTRPVVTEVMPSVGTTLIHSQAEITYCLSEKIRIDTMETMVDDRSAAHIRNFNWRVSDYNSRCANFRHRRSDMDRARGAVEANRTSLQAAAREIVRSWR